jgi:FkbM family methyltransferase
MLSETFYEERQLRHLRDKEIIPPRAHVVDVGAYIGNHTVFFSKILGAAVVHAFEPAPDSAQLLRANIELNDLEGVTVHECGLGAEATGGRIWKQHPTNRGSTRIEVKPGAIPIKRLDDFQLDELDFLKVDTEGMAGLVFDGAEETIAQHRPAVLCEIVEDDERRVVEILRRHGYRVTKDFGEELLFEHG